MRVTASHHGKMGWAHFNYPLSGLCIPGLPRGLASRRCPVICSIISMSVQGAAAFLDGLAQPVAAGKVVVISEEAGIAVVSALDNVHLHTGQVYTGAAGA